MKLMVAVDVTVVVPAVVVLDRSTLTTLAMLPLLRLMFDVPSVNASVFRLMVTAPGTRPSACKVLPETDAGRSMKSISRSLRLTPYRLVIEPPVKSVAAKRTVRLLMLLAAAWAVALPVKDSVAVASEDFTSEATSVAGMLLTVPSLAPRSPLKVSPIRRITIDPSMLPSLALDSARSVSV